MIGAAGLGAIAQLFAGIMQKEELERQRKAQEKAAAEALAYQREKDSKDRLQSAQHDQLSIIKSNGEGQQGALNNLMAMLARAQR